MILVENVTYKKLNKDFQLEDKGFGQYDRVVKNGDFVKVDGPDALVNGIIIKLGVQYGEMRDNPTYQNWGNKCHQLIKEPDTQLNKMQKNDLTKEALMEMFRIKSVNQINVTTTNNARNLETQTTVTSIDDQQFNVEVAQ
jgi:hypothetical protein